jgi:uncharacterized membrane protein YedE/YeeE
MTLLVSFACGLVFGIGLIVAGMADPGKVLAFLDLAGNWDPSLALVMAGAILLGLMGFAVANRRTRSVLGLPMMIPAGRLLDRRLILGSLGFGIGWGLSGVCPGPALVLMGAGVEKAWIFGIAMIAGMQLFEWLEARGTR